MWTDPFGNPLTVQDAASAAAVQDFAGGLVACEARAARILDASEDGSPIVQACVAALHMFSEVQDAPAKAWPAIQQALDGVQHASERERRFVHAVAAWVEGDVASAIRLHQEQAREHPRDLASLKLGQYHLFNQGDAPGLLRLALAAHDAAADVPHLHGMLAFGWEQCHALEAAEAAARHAIALCRKEPWAHHALAHVMLAQGRIHEGRAFLADVSDTWTGLNSFMLTHNWWHQALFAIELDRADEALALYDRQVWGVAKDCTQDQVNAVSLLARLELADVDVGDRWSDLAAHLLARTGDQVLPFLDLHYLIGLARAHKPQAQALLHRIEQHALAPDAAPAWAQVCVPAARGVLAWARGEHALAAGQIGAVLVRLPEIGGSHAQRELFVQIHLDALVRSGQLALAQHLVQPWQRAHPESARLRRQGQRVLAALGLGPHAARFGRVR